MPAKRAGPQLAVRSAPSSRVREPGNVVLDDDVAVAFLDQRPVFPGHVLVVPRDHVETLLDLPVEQIGPLFERVQRVAAAVEDGLGADGSFVAMNNRVSQSVAHLHVHVVPRHRGRRAARLLLAASPKYQPG